MDPAGALGHRERDAVAALLEAGQPMTALIAAGMGDVAALARLLPSARPDQLHAALSMAVLNQELECARLCLEAGADPNAFMLVHQHSTPAHQAATNKDRPMLELLIRHGARLDVRDTLWAATPADWAEHAGDKPLADWLRSIDDGRKSEANLGGSGNPT
jgi:ankyrin repeat protein